jgi:sugar lactone lactonase YvrE
MGLAAGGALVALLGSVGGPVATVGAPARAVRPHRAAAPVGPMVASRVLVPVSLGPAAGVATGPDGTTYVTEPHRTRTFALAPDGTESTVAEGVAGSKVAVGPDGTVVLSLADGLAWVAPDGTVRTTPDGGSAETDGLAFTSDGQLWLTDSGDDVLRTVDADGNGTVVDLTTAGQLRGLAAGPDDSLYAIDLDATDVVHRLPDGTESHVGFTTLADPVALDVEGDRIAVAGGGKVVIREGDGTEADAADLGDLEAEDVDLLADGTLLVAAHPVHDARYPVPPGGLLRVPPGGEPSRVAVGGDVAELSSVAPGPAGSALFTSYPGVRGYSDPNPLRQVDLDRNVADVATAGASGDLVDAAPDGTLYRSDFRTLRRIPPGGSPEAVALPTEPGLDAVIDLAIDERGTTYVAIGSGYGPGGYRVVRLEAGGGTTTVLEDRGNASMLFGIGAGGGLLLAAVGDGVGPHRLVEVHGDGTVTTRKELSTEPVDRVEVDALGNAYLLVARDRTVGIDVVAPDGSTRPLDYAGRAFPRDLAAGYDGTMYVVDDDLGVVALFDAVPIPTEPQPAVPVDGGADFTG